MALSPGLVWEVQSGGDNTNFSGGFRGGAVVATPSAPTVVGAGTGGTVAAATYYCVITLNDGYGETSKSAETSVVLTGATSKFTVTAPANAVNKVGWNLYVGTVSGGPYWSQGAALVLGTDRVVTTTPPTSGTQAPGTDRSQQTSTQVNIDNSTITTSITANVITFTGYIPTAADVGNTVRMLTGTNVTAGVYEIIAFTGTTWTVTGAAALPTSATTTNATGKMGGCLATPAAALTPAVANNTVWLKSATYTTTAALAIGVAGLALRGYGSTRGDGTKATITTATNSVNLITTGTSSGTFLFENLTLSNTAGTRGNGLLAVTAHATTGAWVLTNCVLDGFSNGINSDNVGADFDISNIFLTGCEVKNCTISALSTASSNIARVFLEGCYFHNNVNGTTDIGGLLFAVRTIFYANNYGLTFSNTTFALCQCVFYGNTIHGLLGATASTGMSLVNCVFYGQPAGGHDIFFSGATTDPRRYRESSRNNAYVQNSFWYSSTGDVILTADPFTNAAGGDFSLNATAGGGAVCKATGFPSSFLGLSTASSPDLGAAQHADPAAAAVIGSIFDSSVIHGLGVHS